MRKVMTVLVASVLCLVTGTVVLADHHEEGGGEMPPMGPPAEMQQLEGMNGEYDVKFSYRLDPSSEEWMETAATAVVSTVVGGGAQQMIFEGEMMGMPFQGMGLTSFDRATGKWQTTWVDSMGARISMYTGTFEDGKMVVEGEDFGPDGGTYQSRLTYYNMNDEGWDWTYEMSMDGTNYFVGAKATYRRK